MKINLKSIALIIFSKIMLAGCDTGEEKKVRLHNKTYYYSAEKIKPLLSLDMKSMMVSIENSSYILSNLSDEQMCAEANFTTINDALKAIDINDYDKYIYYRCVLENINNQNIDEINAEISNQGSQEEKESIAANFNKKLQDAISTSPVNKEIEDLTAQNPIFSYFKNNSEDTKLFYQEITSLPNKIAINLAYGKQTTELNNLFTIIKLMKEKIEQNENTEINAAINIYQETDAIVSIYRQPNYTYSYRIGKLYPLQQIFNQIEQGYSCITDNLINLKVNENNTDEVILDTTTDSFFLPKKQFFYLENTASANQKQARNLEVYDNKGNLTEVYNIEIKNTKICMKEEKNLNRLYIRVIEKDESLSNTLKGIKKP